MRATPGGDFSGKTAAPGGCTARGAPLAGDAALAGPARALLDAGDGPEVEVLSAEGGVFAARSDTHAVAVRTSPLALAGVVRRDLRTVLDALG